MKANPNIPHTSARNFDRRQERATVESIPADACICGIRRSRPLSNCWAKHHDFEGPFGRDGAGI